MKETLEKEQKDVVDALQKEIQEKESELMLAKHGASEVQDLLESQIDELMQMISLTLVWLPKRYVCIMRMR